MTLNKDLFGNLVSQKPAAVPISVRKQNKVRVFHGSWDSTPPHARPHDAAGFLFNPNNNLHPKVIHAGTPEATVHRTNIHEYEIDLNHPAVSPVIWGDAPQVLKADAEDEERKKDYEDMPEGYFKPRVDQFNKGMSGKQEGLFENTPADVADAAQTGLVLPYRNRREDAGSISYIIPKSAVGGAVKYIGVYPGKDFRESLTKKR